MVHSLRILQTTTQHYKITFTSATTENWIKFRRPTVQTYNVFLLFVILLMSITEAFSTNPKQAQVPESIERAVPLERINRSLRIADTTKESMDDDGEEGAVTMKAMDFLHKFKFEFLMKITKNAEAKELLQFKE